MHTGEQQLVEDLATPAERSADEEFSFDVYRALAGNALMPGLPGRSGRHRRTRSRGTRAPRVT